MYDESYQQTVIDVDGTIARTDAQCKSGIDINYNSQWDYRILMDTAMAMIAAARIELPLDRSIAALNAEAYALDSTTIDLCPSHFPGLIFAAAKPGSKQNRGKLHKLKIFRFPPVRMRLCQRR